MDEMKVLFYRTFDADEQDELIDAIRAAWELDLYVRVTETPQASGFTLEVSEYGFPDPIEREEVSS